MLGLRVAIAALCLALTGCVSIPNAKQLSVEPDGKAPMIMGAQHPLPASRAEADIKGLARFPGDTEALQRQVALEGQIAGTPLTAGNRVALLQDGPATYAAMKQVISAAKDTIDLESYTLMADSVGNAIADLLVGKRRAGVAVQLIYDSQGSIDTPAAFWDRLRAAGVIVLEYNPLDPGRARIGYSPNDRDHRKLLIVDGRVAIMGGIKHHGNLHLWRGRKRHDRPMVAAVARYRRRTRRPGRRAAPTVVSRHLEGPEGRSPTRRSAIPPALDQGRPELCANHCGDAAGG